MNFSMPQFSIDSWFPSFSSVYSRLCAAHSRLLSILELSRTNFGPIAGLIPTLSLCGLHLFPLVWLASITNMGMCDFCYNNLFRDDDWDGDWIDHHSYAEVWAQAIVDDSCPICTLLWQKLHAIDASQLQDQYNATKDTRTQHIVLALESCRLPVFQAHLRDLASGDFLLSFQSSANSAVPQIVTVNFIIYPLDGESKHTHKFYRKSV
jgi:hypothetical protein